jgi:hypothetical protein
MARDALSGAVKALGLAIALLLVGGFIAVGVKGPTEQAVPQPTPIDTFSPFPTGTATIVETPTDEPTEEPTPSAFPSPDPTHDPSLDGPDDMFPRTGVAAGAWGGVLIALGVASAVWNRRRGSRTR